MPDQLLVEDSQSTADTRILILRGALVLSTIFEFQQMVRQDSSPALKVDMSGVSYCDSAGIGALVNAHVSHSKNGRQFVLRGVTPRVVEVLKITRVDQLFTFEGAGSSVARGS